MAQHEHPWERGLYRFLGFLVGIVIVAVLVSARLHPAAPGVVDPVRPVSSVQLPGPEQGVRSSSGRAAPGAPERDGTAGASAARGSGAVSGRTSSTGDRIPRSHGEGREGISGREDAGPREDPGSEAHRTTARMRRARPEPVPDRDRAAGGRVSVATTVRDHLFGGSGHPGSTTD